MLFMLMTTWQTCLFIDDRPPPTATAQEIVALLRWHDALGTNATIVYAKLARERFDPPFRDHPQMTLPKEPAIYEYILREQLTFRGQEFTIEVRLEKFQTISGNTTIQPAPYSKHSNKGGRILDYVMPDADKPDQPVVTHDRGPASLTGDFARSSRLTLLAFGLGVGELFNGVPTLKQQGEHLLLTGDGALVPGQDVWVAVELDRQLLVRQITMTPKHAGVGVHYHLKPSGRKALGGLIFPERCAVRVFLSAVADGRPVGPVSEDTRFEYELRDFRRHLSDAQYDELTQMDRAKRNAFVIDVPRKEGFKVDAGGQRTSMPPYPSNPPAGLTSTGVRWIIAIHGVAFCVASGWYWWYRRASRKEIAHSD